MVEAAVRVWAALIVLLIGVVGGFFAYERWLAPAPIEYKNIPFPVAPLSLREGEGVVVHAYRCNNTGEKLQAKATRVLRSTDGVYKDDTLPEGTVPIFPGCNTTKSKAIVIPIGTPPGWYYIEGTVQVKTYWKAWVIPWLSAPFEVRN